MEEGVTPFVDDKEQSVNKEKLVTYLAPMPVWWQRLTTIDPVLKVCLRIFRIWIKWVFRSLFIIYPAEPEPILGPTSSWSSAKSVRK